MLTGKEHSSACGYLPAEPRTLGAVYVNARVCRGRSVPWFASQKKQQRSFAGPLQANRHTTARHLTRPSCLAAKMCPVPTQHALPAIATSSHVAIPHTQKGFTPFYTHTQQCQASRPLELSLVALDPANTARGCRACCHSDDRMVPHQPHRTFTRSDGRHAARRPDARKLHGAVRMPTTTQNQTLCS
jgi:hypothetical protein